MTDTRSCALCRNRKPHADFQNGRGWAPHCVDCRAEQLAKATALLLTKPKVTRKSKAKPVPKPNKLATHTSVKAGQLPPESKPVPTPNADTQDRRGERLRPALSNRPGAMDAFYLPSLQMGKRSNP